MESKRPRTYVRGLLLYRELTKQGMHGFISQEEQGFFSHYPATVEESFHFAIQCFINSLKQGEERCSADEIRK